jgi:peroxin-14
VSSAPLEKRIAFLQSKNLTQEEIDIALARAGEEGSTTSPAANPIPGYGIQPPSYRGPPQPGQGYGPAYGQWQAPPEYVMSVQFLEL